MGFMIAFWFKYIMYFDHIHSLFFGPSPLCVCTESILQLYFKAMFDMTLVLLVDI